MTCILKQYMWTHWYVLCIHPLTSLCVSMINGFLTYRCSITRDWLGDLVACESIGDQYLVVSKRFMMTTLPCNQHSETRPGGFSASVSVCLSVCLSVLLFVCLVFLLDEVTGQVTEVRKVTCQLVLLENQIILHVPFSVMVTEEDICVVRDFRGFLRLVNCFV